MAEENGVSNHGIQRPCNVHIQVPEEKVAVLRDRRAGIEPLIGHLKKSGLRKSKMKSDKATLASAYRIVTGFNLRKLVQDLENINIRAIVN